MRTRRFQASRRASEGAASCVRVPNKGPVRRLLFWCGRHPAYHLAAESRFGAAFFCLGSIVKPLSDGDTMTLADQHTQIILGALDRHAADRNVHTCCRAISPEDREPVFALMSRLPIDRLGARGEGVAQSPDGPVFVPYALAGETVAAEVDGSRGTLVEVLTPSPHRIAPFCRYFSRCGGFAGATPAAGSYARVES